ncbi:hypothetical protein EOW52_23190, partial [Salmonella enterica]|nr:hypothetical protein [Salmonella enterica]EIP9979663.1 helix-turn-helix domain-containing protein [Salmonella enterica]
IIKELNSIGLFKFPVTTKIVSSVLGISVNTIYKHLRTLNSKMTAERHFTAIP